MVEPGQRSGSSEPPDPDARPLPDLEEGSGATDPPSPSKTIKGSGNDGGSKFDLAYGRRPMKGYPITEGELGQLTAIGGGALFFFSLAAGLFGFSLDVVKDLALAPELPKEITATWETISSYVKNSSIASVLVGCALLWWRHSILKRIKDETIFPGDADGAR